MKEFKIKSCSVSDRGDFCLSLETNKVPFAVYTVDESIFDHLFSNWKDDSWMEEYTFHYFIEGNRAKVFERLQQEIDEGNFELGIDFISDYFINWANDHLLSVSKYALIICGESPLESLTQIKTLYKLSDSEMEGFIYADLDKISLKKFLEIIKSDLELKNSIISDWVNNSSSP